MAKYFLILILSFGFVTVSNGQDVVNNPFYDIYFQSKEISLSNVPYRFKTRVNLLDQFFKRFNMEINIEGEDIYANDIAPLLTLPNGKRYWNEIKRMMLHYITDSTAYYKDTTMYRDFENTIIKNNISLKFNDGLWYAIADADAVLNESKIKIKIILDIVRDRKGYKWAISDMFFPGNSLDKIKTGKIDKYPQVDSSIFINPMSHETNFIGLDKMINSKDLISLLNKDVDKHLKDKLIYLISSKKMTISYIKNVEFAFKTVPGYTFFVKYHNRPDQNSGWLISDLKYTKKIEK